MLLQVLIRCASIRDISNIIKITGFCREQNNFYSEIEGNIIKYILSRNCYLISSKCDISGMILINNAKKSVYFIPSGNKNLSFFRLIYILKKQLNLSGYKFTVNYKKLNLSNIQKYFSFYVLSSLKHMKLNLLEYNQVGLSSNNIKIRKLNAKKETSLRVELQNKIFGHIKGRPELTESEVLSELRDPSYIENFCFVMEYNQNPVGYGQIILMSDNYYLVNFGIIPNFRGHGLGFIFVSELLNICRKNGLKELHLKVDNSNEEAVSLYKKAGFKEILNILSIML